MTSRSSENPLYLIVFAGLVFWGCIVFLQGLATFIGTLLGFWFWRILFALALGLVAFVDTRVTFFVLEDYFNRSTPESVKSRAFTILFLLSAFAVVFGLTTFFPENRIRFAEMSIGLALLSALWIGAIAWYSNRR